ncbi:MAG: tetratricopeptide repeat protein [Gammaproteobacteria bacterium]|nr:tetratricopeptide repeat protein [Gammaproteobacteria bacterium]
MSAHLNDQELIDTLGRWWKKFGNYAVVLILGAAVVMAGWRYWQNQQATKLETASLYYQVLLNDVAKNQTADAVTQANYIIKNYSGSSYANMAALFLAQLDVAQNNLPLAQQQLQTLVKQNSSGPFQAIASLRLARVDISLQQPQAALGLLAKIPAGYEISYNIVRGDAYAQMKQFSDANASYQAALNAVPQNDKPLQNMIHLRINTIPATS